MLAQISFIHVAVFMRPGKIVLIGRLIRIGVRRAHRFVGVALMRGSLLMVSEARAESSNGGIHPEGCKRVTIRAALPVWRSESSISLSLIRRAEIGVRNESSTPSWY
jgi:hypothetical protein